jgi:GT2 family glycosyltransferase
MSETRFGVVLINWNGANDTIASLDSLLSATPQPEHVVVIDNGSADDSLARVQNWASSNAPSWAETNPTSPASVDGSAWLMLIAADRNLGFSGGNNVGLRVLAERTNATHFLLLNNDAMVAVDYFAHMARAIDELPSAGLLGALIYRHPERDNVWFAGAVETPWRALIKHRTGVPDAQTPFATPFVTGCAMVISRQLYDANGGLAEVYNPIYWEDADYSCQARMRGWPVVIVPRAHVYHRVGASGAGEVFTPRTAFSQNRNRAIFVRRNYHGLDRVMALSYLTATKPARALLELLRGRGPVGAAIFRGFWQGMTQRLA